MSSQADLVSMAKYICLVKKREIGPTANAAEMIVLGTYLKTLAQTTRWSSLRA